MTMLPTAMVLLASLAFSPTVVSTQGNGLAPTAAELPADEPLFASPTRLDRIGRIVAPVTINGQGPFRLIVDTGATHSTISPALVGALGVIPETDSAAMLNGVTGAAIVPMVVLDRLEVGELKLKNARVAVLRPSVNAGADGILGMAALRHERLHVDFRLDRISISRSRRALQMEGFHKIPARLLPGGLMVVDARVGGVRAVAVLDTGAERTLGNAALRDALRARRRQAKTVTLTPVLGATADIALGESEVSPPMRLGGVTVTSTQIIYGDFHIFDVWDLQSRPAVLVGMDVLGIVDALIVDFRSQDFYIRVRNTAAPAARSPIQARHPDMF